jgi:hypothetical protein
MLRPFAMTLFVTKLSVVPGVNLLGKVMEDWVGFDIVMIFEFWFMRMGSYYFMLVLSSFVVVLEWYGCGKPSC